MTAGEDLLLVFHWLIVFGSVLCGGRNGVFSGTGQIRHVFSPGAGASLARNNRRTVVFAYLASASARKAGGEAGREL
jgi:hypothetical protein